MKNAAKRLLTAATDLYSRYPARCNSYIVAGVVAIGAAVGQSVDPHVVGPLVALEVPILLGGEATHRRVSPAKGR
jgi:hypothetical protein